MTIFLIVIAAAALPDYGGDSWFTPVLIIIMISVGTAWCVTCFAREINFSEAVSNLARWSLAILPVIGLSAAFYFGAFGRLTMVETSVIFLAVVAAFLLKRYCAKREKEKTDAKFQNGQDGLKNEMPEAAFASGSLHALAPEDDANYRTGMDFLKGTHGRERSLPQALHYFEISAQLGSAYGSYQLSRMYERGEGMEKPDRERALYWMEKACALGHPQAEKRLRLLKAFWDE